MIEFNCSWVDVCLGLRPLYLDFVLNKFLPLFPKKIKNNRIIVDVKNEERALPYKGNYGGERLLTTNMG